MTITAMVIADSVSPEAHGLKTMQIRMPHFILPQLTRHRVFSFGVSSSRAVPVRRLIDEVINDPVNPRWGSNRPGMQPGDDLEGEALAHSIGLWDEARTAAVGYARRLAVHGAAKEVVNRILEPYSHVNLIVTGTEWDNFYKLRRHETSQHEIHELADRMFEAQAASVPVELDWGEWHLPYVDKAEQAVVGIITALKLSTARCARVSYGNKATIASDLKLYDRLIASDPQHASPSEHQAMPTVGLYTKHERNLRGWVQNRAMIEAGKL